MEVPVIKFLGHTRHSIIIEWTGSPRPGVAFRAEIEDSTYEWITKYWGLKNKTEIKELGPERLYNIRVGVSEEIGGIWTDELYSDVLTAATAYDHPWTFYLFQQVETGAATSVEAFIKQREDCTEIYNRYGDTPLILAIRRRKEDTVQVLLKGGADVSQPGKALRKTPLMVACFEGYKAAAEALVGRGGAWSHTDSNSCTPLHYAVDGCQLEMVRYGIQCGANINAKDRFGWTPLMRAVGADLPIISVLIESGADANLKDSNEMTAYGLSRLLGDPEITEYLRRRTSSEEETIPPAVPSFGDDLYEAQGDCEVPNAFDGASDYDKSTQALIGELKSMMNK